MKNTINMKNVYNSLIYEKYEQFIVSMGEIDYGKF